MRSKNKSLNQAGKVVGELYMSNELHVQMSEFLVALGGVIAVPVCSSQFATSFAE